MFYQFQPRRISFVLCYLYPSLTAISSLDGKNCLSVFQPQTSVEFPQAITLRATHNVKIPVLSGKHQRPFTRNSCGHLWGSNTSTVTGRGYYLSCYQPHDHSIVRLMPKYCLDCRANNGQTADSVLHSHWVGSSPNERSMSANWSLAASIGGTNPIENFGKPPTRAKSHPFRC